MSDNGNAIIEQVEKGFNYRGHVTVETMEGERLECYLFNRQIEQGYIEVFAKNSDTPRRFEISDLKAITLTGKDHAETFDQFQKRTDT